jgi:hypothetical protein
MRVVFEENDVFNDLLIWKSCWESG